MLNHTELAKLMGKAYHEATKSPDPSNQNGAVLVSRFPDGQYEIIGKGYNHFYNGIPANVEDRTAKMRGIEHAERDCIYNAASRGNRVGGSILVCPWVACGECARAIIGSGVAAVVYHQERADTTPERWQADIDEALGWIIEAGIYIYVVSGLLPISGIPFINVNGKKWSPASGEYLG